MDNNEVKYELTFLEALEIVLNGGAVKGENFIDGIYLKLNGHGQLVTVDAGRLYKEDVHTFLDSLNRQKFRELTVMTMRELTK